TVIAPLDRAALDPEMTSARIQLVDGRCDARSTQPIHRYCPARTPRLAKRKHKLFTTATGTAEASPLFKLSIFDNDNRAWRKLLRARMAVHDPPYQIRALNEPNCGEAAAKDVCPHDLNPPDREMGQYHHVPNRIDRC